MGERRGGKLTTACREGVVNLLHYICQVRGAVVGVQQLIWTHTHARTHTQFQFLQTNSGLVPRQGEKPFVEKWCKVLFDHCFTTKVHANAGLCIHVYNTSTSEPHLRFQRAAFHHERWKKKLRLLSNPCPAETHTNTHANEKAKMKNSIIKG